VDLQIQGQLGLQSEFQDGQGYTEKPCLEKQTIRIFFWKKKVSVYQGEKLGKNIRDESLQCNQGLNGEAADGLP